MSLRLDLDISGVRVSLDGLPAPETAILRELWRGYVRPGTAGPSCRVVVEESPRRLTAGRVLPAAMTIEPVAGGMRFLRDEAELRVSASTSDAVLALAQGDAQRRAWGVANLLGALLAWHLAERGGGALHAAGIVLERRAFVLVGPEGSGKTTFARIAADNGLPVISDDVVLVEATGGGLYALGAPVRDRSFPAPGPGRWPVAALLVPAFGRTVGLEPVPRLVSEPRVGANLLYLSRAWEGGGRAQSAVEGITGAAPAYRLCFAPDASFLAVLRTLIE